VKVRSKVMERGVTEVKSGLCNGFVSESLTLLHTLKKLVCCNLDQKKRNSTINHGQVCQNPVGKSYCHTIAPSLFCQVSKASQSLSSRCSNHRSSSGPYPTQHTRYWCPLPLRHLPMILSIAYSSMPSDVMIGLGLTCSQPFLHQG